ncbi:hexose kinase [Streptomyces sp. NPDC005955]|uniref:1-phosphofructokinase family hexose kinase n=1 Tax=Streptomyces sp. NPDC005955 TaxID=3364738 RepID=UPI0036D130A6
MILTVTLNTALDLTYRVPTLRPHSSHRVTEVIERPGGKGVNVARVLAALGRPVTVTGFVGGGTGRALRAGLAQRDPDGLVTDALVPVAGATRRTVVVVDAVTGNTTRLGEPGPLVSAAEWNAFLDRYDALVPTASAVALCGSLPPGVPVGAYARLVRTAKAASVPVLLDTGGEPLRRGVAARPDLVKPNADELAELTGSHDPAQATRETRRRGARAVIASLGPEGLLAVTPEGRWRAVPPGLVKGNPTGAGDSAVAGLLDALVADEPWPVRLTRAVALSAATVRAPAAGEFDACAYEEYLGRVRVTADPLPS